MGVIFQNGLSVGTTPNYTFTITSNMFNNLSVVGGYNEGHPNGTSGFTVDNAVSNIWNGVYGNIISNREVIDTVWTNAGITPGSWNGYICNVTWGPGSTIASGLAKVTFVSNIDRFFVISVDPTDTNYLSNDGNANSGTSLAGTFNFPATFTLITPVDNKGGWC